MDVVASWTGQRACSLASAYRKSLDSFAEFLGVGTRTASNWAAKPGMVPSLSVQEALDTAFEQAPEAVRARFWALEEVPRPAAARPARGGVQGQFLALAGAAVIGELGEITMAALAGRADQPGRIGLTDAADLEAVIDGMERADHSAGGRTVVRSLALGQLRWAQETLAGASFAQPAARTAWMTATARLGRLAGFMSVDAHQGDDARRCFLVALQIAAGADDWPARLNVMSGMVRQAVHAGDGAGALKICTLARAGEGSASATTRAMLRVLEARSYGVLGRTAEALGAVRQAEDLFAGRQPGDDPPYLWFYDEAQLYGDTGHALFPLALAGHDVDAQARLRRAVDLHSAADTRGRAFSLTKLATLEVAAGPGAASFARARAAIAATAGLRSGRALDYLRDLGSALGEAEGDEARGLAAGVSEVLSAGGVLLAR